MLAVDGRSTAAAAVVSTLRGAGYRTLVAHDARGALDLLARERADAALIHHALLDRTGSLIRHLRSLAPGFPVIVHGGAAADPARWGLDVGVASVDGDVERLRELLAFTLAATRCVDSLRDEHELRSLALRQLCHTLRGPLDVIQGYTELLREAPPAAAAQVMLDGLATAVASAMQLTGEHLALAALDAPGLEVRCEPVEIDGLIDDLRRRAARPASGRRIHLIASTPFHGAILYTDGDKLRALLGQLLTRAAECAPRGVLRLCVRATDGGTRFELLDRAVRSMPPRGALSAAEGLGDPLGADTVGMALAQRLGELLNARLGTRRGPKGGAIFTLHLPAALTLAPADASRRPPEEGSTRSARRRMRAGGARRPAVEKGERGREAVLHLQLGKDTGEVRLHRLLADAQLAGDLLVADAPRHLRQHFMFAPGQAVQSFRLLRGPRHGALKRLEDLAIEAGIDPHAALGDGAHRVRHRHQSGRLEHIAARPTGGGAQCDLHASQP